jgi:hypothetical protein
LHFIAVNIALRKYNVICFAARRSSVDRITLPEQIYVVGVGGRAEKSGAAAYGL